MCVKHKAYVCMGVGSGRSLYQSLEMDHLASWAS